MNLEPAVAAVIESAVRSFARKCIDHPQLEQDPVCVIATMREDTCAELHQPWADIVKPPQKAIHKRRAI